MPDDKQSKGAEGGATTGGGATSDRGTRDIGTPGPDPDERASGSGTGVSPRYAEKKRADVDRDTPIKGVTTPHAEPKRG
jgi:hypothetical protein